MSEQDTQQNTSNKNMIRTAALILFGGFAGIIIMFFGIMFGPEFPSYAPTVLMFIILGGFAVFALLIISLMRL